jgi:hypothetical protein
MLRQQLADGPFVHANAELAQDAIPQVHTPPAHHPVPLQVRAGLGPSDQLLFLRLRQRWVPARRMKIAEPVKSVVILAMHPVAQRLTVHTHRARRLFARGSVQHRRDR